ncbi:MAG TPA: DUF86 domain-containing protein [Methanosarcinales archaeon]|nr:DUF86 domain-containing protein [Methanosarcinales archaeon]
MKERIERYKDKINYIVRNVESIQKDAESELELGGIFYGLHTAIEASMDVMAMLLKDMGEVVEDDYSNIMRLEKIGILSADLADRLRKCNGLRNYLVHRYNSVDDAIVLDSRSEVRDIFYEFIEIVERLLDGFGTDQG